MSIPYPRSIFLARVRILRGYFPVARSKNPRIRRRRKKIKGYPFLINIFFKFQRSCLNSYQSGGRKTSRNILKI